MEGLILRIQLSRQKYEKQTEDQILVKKGAKIREFSSRMV